MRPPPRALALAAFLAAPALFAQPPFPVLTLDGAIRLALAHNREFKVVSYDPDIARANYLTAVGQFEPSLVVNRSYSVSQTEEVLDTTVLDRVTANTYSAALQGQSPWGLTYSIGAQAQNTTDFYHEYPNGYYAFGGVNITQPLLKNFGFAANLLNVRLAKANRAISDWTYRQGAIDTVANVVVAYNNLMLAHDNLRIAHSFQDLANALVSDNEKGYRIGSNSKSDVIQAQAQAAGREEQVLIADLAVRNAENNLRELIGQDAFPPDQALYVLEPAPLEPIAVQPEKDLQTALDLRPDYQEARLGVVANRATEAAARNGLLPEVDFVGGYGYNGLSSSFTAARQMVYDRDSPSYSAGLQVTIPLAFAQARGRARSARLQREQAEADLKRLQADIALNLATDAGQIETTAERVRADRVAYDLAKQALDDEVKKFRAGNSSASTFTVLGLQGNLAQEELSVSAALAAQRNAAAIYEHDLGTILLAHHIVLEGDGR